MPPRAEPNHSRVSSCVAWYKTTQTLAIRARIILACAAALEMSACDYRFVRRYLERHPQMPLSLRQVDPLIRQLTLYRDLIESKTRQEDKS